MADSKRTSIIAVHSGVEELHSTKEPKGRPEPPSSKPPVIRTTGYERYCVNHDSSQRIRNLAHRMDIKKNIAHCFPHISEHDARKAYTEYVKAFIEARRLRRKWNREGQPVPRDERRRVDEKLAQAMDLAGVPTVK